MISYRGQTEEYFIERPVCNPIFSNNGSERLILPSSWRSYAQINKLIHRPCEPDFLTIKHSEELLYHGINLKRVRQIINENDIMSFSDIEYIDDDEVQDYYNRSMDNICGYYDNLNYVLEQHYGFPTKGLDITYNFATAVFFATHKFCINSENKAYYKRINDLSKSVVYSFIFRWPTVKKTEWMIRDIPNFKHLDPLRPIKQECALPFFHYWEINGAVTNVHLVFKLDDTFDFTDIPKSSDLFPSAKEDLFYAKLLELKYKQPEKYGCIPDYVFYSD